MNKAMKRWMVAASSEQQAQLARLAGTTVGTLYQLTSEHRHASSQLAIDLEKAAARVKQGDVPLPPLSRMDLNKTCRGCDFAKACTSKDKLW
jgi:hypothetical protein